MRKRIVIIVSAVVLAVLLCGFVFAGGIDTFKNALSSSVSGTDTAFEPRAPITDNGNDAYSVYIYHCKV